MRKKTVLIKVIQSTLILSGVLLCLSCGNLFNQNSSSSNNDSNEKGYLSISAGTRTTSRTITPELSLATLQNFKLKGTREGIEELNESATTIANFKDR